MDKTIAEISAIKHPPPEIKTRLSELSEVRSAYHREIDGLIRQRQEEIGQRREKVKAKVIAHYAKRVEELNKLIAEIESNPKVAERLQALREQKKKEAEAREKALREEILSDCERYTQSVLARQNSAFERLAEVYRQIQAQEGAGMKEIKRRLTEITSWEISADNLRELARLITDFRRRRQAAGGSEMSAEEKKEEQMIKSRLAKIRKLVETSIVDGEGKWRINHLAEIMPWEVTRSSIMYSDAISELSDAYNKEALRKLAAEGNKRAAIALENMEAATINNSLLREIYGKYRVYDKKTGELLLGWAWQAMEERRVNDAMGITGRRREERKMAERYEEEFDSAAAEIVKRGGFIMDNIPIIENVKGLKKRVGKGKCAVRLEKKKSQLRRDASGKVVGGGNDYLEVVEFVGIITKPDGGIEKVREIMGLRSGITSTLDMRGFPEWFREQLARASAKKDKDIGKL